MDADFDPRLALLSSDSAQLRPTMHSCLASAVVLLIGIALAGAAVMSVRGGGTPSPSSPTMTAPGTAR